MLLAHDDRSRILPYEHRRLIGRPTVLVDGFAVGAWKVTREGSRATLRMPSGETRMVDARCRATIGEVGNDEHNLRSYGKAGAKRWRGIRPTVRGETMNPVDHPLGGRTRGNRHPVSPWGWNTKGLKTRHNKRTDNMIVQRRQNRIR